MMDSSNLKRKASSKHVDDDRQSQKKPASLYAFASFGKLNKGQVDQWFTDTVRTRKLHGTVQGRPVMQLLCPAPNHATSKYYVCTM